MTTAISDAGIQFASGNIVNVASAMPSSGSYTAGDIVLENTTAARISGWKRLTTGSNHVLGTDWSYFAGVTAGTAVATTSGTAIDFTGIPSWVKRITLSLDSVSTNGASIPIIQLGKSAGVETSGYVGSAITAGGTPTLFTTGAAMSGTWAATSLISGQVVITLLNASTNLWTITSSVGFSNAGALGQGAFSKTLAGTLDRIRLTTVNGTDTFDAGSVNILWE